MIKNFRVLTLKSGKDEVFFVIDALKNGVLKVTAEMPSGDTTVTKSMIFKKKK